MIELCLIRPRDGGADCYSYADTNCDTNCNTATFSFSTTSSHTGAASVTGNPKKS